MDGLKEELNKFAHRYSINESGEMFKTYQEIFYIDKNGKIGLHKGVKGETDCVFNIDENSLGLICATSKDNTESQNQVYKFAGGLERQTGKVVYPYLYCDAQITRNKIQSSNTGLKNIAITDEEITAINLLAGFQVFRIRRIKKEESAIYDRIFNNSQIQYFNDLSGKRLYNLDASGKLKALEHSIEVIFNMIGKNKSYWLNNGIAKDLPKRTLISLAKTYKWFKTKNLFSNKSIDETGKASIGNHVFGLEVNLTDTEREVFEDMQMLLGIELSLEGADNTLEMSSKTKPH
jgi:hypothetical protein